MIISHRPVVEVNATLKADPDPVDADKTCPGSAGACFKINFCLNYNLREFPIQKLSKLMKVIVLYLMVILILKRFCLEWNVGNKRMVVTDSSSISKYSVFIEIEKKKKKR